MLPITQSLQSGKEQMDFALKSNKTQVVSNLFHRANRSQKTGLCLTHHIVEIKSIEETLKIWIDEKFIPDQRCRAAAILMIEYGEDCNETILGSLEDIYLSIFASALEEINWDEIFGLKMIVVEKVTCKSDLNIQISLFSNTLEMETNTYPIPSPIDFPLMTLCEALKSIKLIRGLDFQRFAEFSSLIRQKCT